MNRIYGVFGLFLVCSGCGEKPDETAEGGGSSTSPAGESSGGAVPTSGGAASTSGGTEGATGESGGAGEGSSGGATSEPGTGGTTGAVDEDCVDPQAPGCTACNAMGVPQRLFGLTWNFAQGEPGSGLGSEELRCVVPETGETGLIAAIPGMDWLQVELNTYDRENDKLYAVAYANADNIKRIFSIDTISGQVIANPAFDQTLNWSGGLHVRSDAAVVGVTWNQALLQEELHLIDTATGETEFVAAIPEIASLYALYAFDAASDTAFMVGFASGQEGQHLFSVDVHDGATQALKFAENPALAGIHVRADGVLLGLVFNNGATSLVAIDRETAGITTIAAVPDMTGVPTTEGTYDDAEDVLFVVDVEHRLWSIDASTGAVLASPMLDGPSNPNYEYNWSGGLHFR
mgnify:CR=1 FL=1